jgi:hypothetical protein
LISAIKMTANTSVVTVSILSPGMTAAVSHNATVPMTNETIPR